jgi:hypothetical protein
MSDKRKEYWKKRYQENKPDNAHRKATSAHGTLDSLVIRAEEAASFLSRRNNPPNYTLNRIMDLVEKAQKHIPTRVTPSGTVIKETRQEKIESNNRQKEKAIERIWKAYYTVLDKEVMDVNEVGKDESRNNAKQDVNGRWVSEPLTYYGDHLEHVLSDELHGNKAKGITAIKNSGYDNDNKSEE